MCIGAEPETEVPDVLRLIVRLAHRAQQHRLDELGFGTALHGLDDAAQVLRGQLVRRRQLEAEALQEQQQLFELLGARRLVHAEECRQP